MLQLSKGMRGGETDPLLTTSNAELMTAKRRGVSWAHTEDGEAAKPEGRKEEITENSQVP